MEAASGGNEFSSSPSSDGALSDDDLRQVAESLAGTGFLLEHRVHRTLQMSGFNAFLGALYADKQSGRSREMDVVVRQHYDTVEPTIKSWCSIVVECKAWANPVVVIGRPRAEMWRARIFEEVRTSGGPLAQAPEEVLAQLGDLATYLGLRNLSRSVEQGHFIGNQMVLLERGGGASDRRPRAGSTSRPAATEFEARTQPSVQRNRSGYKAKNEGVYDSVLLPLAKAMAHEQSQLLPDGTGTASHYLSPTIVMSFPVVVTSGPLIEAVPGADPAEEDGVQVREVGWTRLLRHFDDPDLPRSVLVELVQERYLGAWLNERVGGYVEQVHDRVREAALVFEAAAGGRQVDLTMLHMVANAWTTITTG